MWLAPEWCLSVITQQPCKTHSRQGFSCARLLFCMASLAACAINGQVAAAKLARFATASTDLGSKHMAQPATAAGGYGRWYVLLLISVMYLITYLDRVNISTAAPAISKEFGFDKITMGVIFSAFAWSYALFQVPGGWLSDRFGARGVLACIVAYWSIMTAATAMAFSATSFFVVRFLFGIGEAGAFPVATRAMQNWY